MDLRLLGQDDEALFDSAFDALRFALAYQGRHQAPLMNRVMAAGSKPGKGLGGDDGAGQAGLIRASLDQLAKLQKAVLIARIAPDAWPCSCVRPCCSGVTPNEEWTNAIAVLTDESRQHAFAGTTADRVARRAIIVRHFRPKDRREAIEVLAKNLELNRKTVGGHVDRVTKWLRDLEKDAQTAVDGYLSGYLQKNEKFSHAA